MRYVRLQMLNETFHLYPGEFKHLQVMRKRFPLDLKALYENQVFSVTIESDSSLSNVKLLGVPVSGFSCFWVPLFDKNRMEWAVEKLTELGVGAIAFYYSDHCTYNAKQIEKISEQDRLSRFEKKIWAAAQQSGNLSPPKIVGVYSIYELQKDHFAGRTYGWTLASKEIIQIDTIPCLGSLEDFREIKDLLDDRLTHFVIGPEGDFSNNEIRALGNINWGCMNRSTILRTETALVAIAAQLKSPWLPFLHLFSKGTNE